MQWMEATAVQSLSVFQMCAFLKEKAVQYILAWHSEWVNISRHKTKGKKTNNFQLLSVLNKHQALCALTEPSTRILKDLQALLHKAAYIHPGLE